MIVRYSRRIWVISLLVFIAAVAAIVLNAYSPGWAVLSADQTHVSVSQRNYRMTIPAPDAWKERDAGFINAYDTVVSSHADQLVEARLARHFWATPLAIKIFSTCSGRRENPARLSTLVVRVSFHDDSQRTYTYDCWTRHYVPIANTAQDSGMNIIPESARMAANGGINTYGFVGSGGKYDRRNLEDQLVRFNAAGSYSGASPNLTCVWNPSEKAPLRCHSGT